MVDDHFRLDQHSHRYEKDRDEHVAHGMHVLLDSHALPRLRDERAGDEGTESDRISEPESKESRGEADPDCRHKRGLALVELDDGPDQARNDEQAEANQTDEEGEQSYRREAEAFRRYSAADGNCGKNRNQENGNEVLDDEDPEYDLRQPPAHVLFGKRPRDDRRAGDRNHRPGEYALDRRPSESAPDKEPEAEHHAGLEQRGDSGSSGNLDDSLQAELEAQREHQQDDAELGESPHHLFVGGERNGRMRAYDHTGQQITEYDGLSQPLKNDCRDRGRAQHERKVLEKRVRV